MEYDRIYEDLSWDNIEKIPQKKSSKKWGFEPKQAMNQENGGLMGCSSSLV